MHPICNWMATKKTTLIPGAVTDDSIRFIISNIWPRSLSDISLCNEIFLKSHVLYLVYGSLNLLEEDLHSPLIEKPASFLQCLIDNRIIKKPDDQPPICSFLLSFSSSSVKDFGQHIENFIHGRVPTSVLFSYIVFDCPESGLWCLSVVCSKGR